MKKIISCFFPILTAFTLTGNALAADTIHWKLSESGELFDVARTYQNQNEQPDEVTQVLRSTDVHFTDDHVIHHVKSIWFYPSSRDIENHGDHSIYFNEKIENLTLLSVASIDKSGGVKSINPSSLQILDTDNSRSFSDTKEVVLTIPGLTGGSLAVIEYEIVRDHSKQETDWSQVFFTQSGYPIQKFDLAISWTTSQQLYWSSNSNDVECKETDHRLQCSGADIPVFKNDNNIYWRDHIGQVSIGESQDWQQVIETSDNAMNSALSDTAGVDELLKKIISDTEDINDKIHRIHEFVARNIRYVSMSELGHTITPHSVASIIKNRYGDCKDKSILLHELLRRIGIESYPVLVATDRTDPSELILPTLSYFDHIVMCFDHRGQQYCLDATDQDTHWKYTPAWIQNSVSLTLKPNQKPSTIANSQFRWKMDVDTRISFNKEGGQTEAQERKFYGEYAASMRNLLLDKTSADREKWLTKEYHDEVSTYADPLFDIVELPKMKPELVISSNADIKPFLDTTSDLTYEENDAWIKDELEIMRLQNDHYDEHFSGLKVQSKFEYDTNGIWTITNIPPNLDFVHQFGSMNRHAELTKNGKLVITTDLAIAEQTIKQNQIESFNAFLDLLNRESLIRFNGKLTKKTNQ
ncbi:DUF3857 and transglutaminase domain-containing protein [Vibrio sp. Of7-15]|uniref:DUF3857 domain-containing protein n=1 Tax=Vibrio sp. Of7-15 TaxID=2724879 RepID=UPI001EF20EDE|nr:DUF3857 domain-containing protein [Vibrio sp. Of7-15]MCG7497825.1 DUF3857 and transglutaminase domain-containing protein [Vibrio sp. Of7-15]